MVNMTDQQLRALGKKHLLVIIRDLEKELQRALLDKEELTRAYQCGLTQNEIHGEFQPGVPRRDAEWYIDSGRTSPQQQMDPQAWQSPGVPQPQYAQPQWPAQPQLAYHWQYTDSWQ